MDNMPIHLISKIGVFAEEMVLVAKSCYDDLQFGASQAHLSIVAGAIASSPYTRLDLY
jgi:hypothetical protein